MRWQKMQGPQLSKKQSFPSSAPYTQEKEKQDNQGFMENISLL